MKVRTLTLFGDLVENVDRKPGDIFEVSEQRFKQINAAGYGVLVEAVEEPEPEKPAEPKKTQEKRSSRYSKLK